MSIRRDCERQGGRAFAAIYPSRERNQLMNTFAAWDEVRLGIPKVPPAALELRLLSACGVRDPMGPCSLAFPPRFLRATNARKFSRHQPSVSDAHRLTVTCIAVNFLRKAGPNSDGSRRTEAPLPSQSGGIERGHLPFPSDSADPKN
jgi:hypothetical protein